MQRKLLLIISCIGITFFAGCASTSTGKRFDSSKVHSIIVGTSTKEDVSSLEGEPYSKNSTAEGISTWTYFFSDTTTSSVNRYLNNMYGIGKQGAKAKNLTVSFNKSGVVTTCIYTINTTEGKNLYELTVANTIGGDREQLNCADVKEPPQ